MLNKTNAIFSYMSSEQVHSLTTDWTMTIQIRRFSGLSFIRVHSFNVDFEFDVVLPYQKSTRSQRMQYRCTSKNLEYEVVHTIRSAFSTGVRCEVGVAMRFQFDWRLIGVAAAANTRSHTKRFGKHFSSRFKIRMRLIVAINSYGSCLHFHCSEISDSI